MYNDAPPSLSLSLGTSTFVCLSIYLYLNLYIYIYQSISSRTHTNKHIFIYVCGCRFVCGYLWACVREFLSLCICVCLPRYVHLTIQIFRYNATIARTAPRADRARGAAAAEEPPPAPLSGEAGHVFRSTRRAESKGEDERGKYWMCGRGGKNKKERWGKDGEVKGEKSRENGSWRDCEIIHD